MLKSTKIILGLDWFMMAVAVFNLIISSYTQHMSVEVAASFLAPAIGGGIALQMWALNRDLKIKYGSGFRS